MTWLMAAEFHVPFIIGINWRMLFSNQLTIEVWGVVGIGEDHQAA